MNNEVHSGVNGAVIDASWCEVLREPAAIYHSRTAIGNSMLSLFLRSPRLYQAKHILGQVIDEDRETDALDLGTGSHAWALEPDSFGQQVAIVPENVLGANGARSTKMYREWAAAEEQRGKVLLREKDWQRVKAIRRALLEHPVAGALIRNSTEREQTIVWTCRETNLNRKCRLDMATEYLGRRLIADLKTSSDHTPDAFSRAMHRYGYHRQAAFYQDGWEAAHDEKLPYVLVVVARGPPHVVRVYHLDEPTIRLGRKQVLDGLTRLAECQRTGDWSEPGEGIIAELALPKYAFYEE